MPKFTVAATAIVFTNVEADTPEEAAASWWKWRDRNAVLKPCVGVTVLQTFDLTPQLFGPGGKAVGFIVQSRPDPRKSPDPREVRVVAETPANLDWGGGETRWAFRKR